MKYKPKSNTPIPSKMQRGFTILEVIIVLVIAAIIMIAVFLVVPQLQNSQKNNRIRNDASRVLAAFIQHTQTGPILNTAGTLPLGIGTYTLNTAQLSWLKDILGPLKAPDGNYYIANYKNLLSLPTFGILSNSYDEPRDMLVVTQACGSIAVQASSTASTAVYSVTFYQYQANGSAGSGCIDNQ